MMRIITFASGSTGNCALLSDGDTHILIDAGISMRRITKCLAAHNLTEKDITGVLITHEHGDHTAGLKTMAKRACIRICAPRTIANHLRWKIPGIDEVLDIIPTDKPFPMGEINVLAFHTSHDTDESVGYRFSGSAELGYCTDTGCVTEGMLEALCGVDAAVIEANHDEELLRYGEYPYFLKRRVLSDRGHLSNEACAHLAAQLCEAGAQKFILAHLSQENNRPDFALQAVNMHLASHGHTAQVLVAPIDGFCGIEIEGRADECWQSNSSVAVG